jgi:hypothetical protein
MCAARNCNVTETIQIARYGHGYSGSTASWSQTAMKRGPIFAFTILSLSLSFAASAETTETCRLTEADLAANAKLSFDDFDQRGTTPATARKLGERKCYAEAARASEHYLLFGPELDAGKRAIVAWHMGQYLASAGDEKTAAKIIAGTRRYPNPVAEDLFDWNIYVVGTWAFLTKNRALLQDASKKLSAAPGDRNAITARVLRGLERCFDKLYDEAYGGACAKQP